MKMLSDMRSWGWSRWVSPAPVQRAFVQLQNFFGHDGDETARRLRRVYIGLLKRVLLSDGRLDATEIESFRRLLNGTHSEGEVDDLVALLKVVELPSTDDAVRAFSPLPGEEQMRLMRGLLSLAFDSGNLAGNRTWLNELAARLELPPEWVETVLESLAAEQAKREKIIRSGTGILVALIVIAVFILTATLLKSVIFGLIGAYLMLPLEQFFERRFRLRSGVWFRLSEVLRWIALPFRKLSNLLRRGGEAETSEADRDRAEQHRITAKAVSFTVGAMVGAILLFAVLVGGFAAHSVDNLRATVDRWTDAPAGTVATDSSTPPVRSLIVRFRRYLDERRGEFEKIPVIKAGVEMVSRALTDEAAQRELAGMVLRRTGGVFTFTAGALGWICQFLVNVLLTVFFFLFFLGKLAGFCRGNASADRQSEYLVRTVFNSAWLPGAGEATLHEAQRIIGAVIGKLKVWIRGYATLICIDLVVYTGGYCLLGVPYFFVLGPIAACCVVLPILGPLGATLLTLLVTLAAGGASVSGIQLFGIVLLYLIENTLIEQFILYPVIFGGALGLSTLETIIVVLLGGIFAGISGMIFAIPTAAILKYLVPQIYRCLERRRELRNEGSEGA